MKNNLENTKKLTPQELKDLKRGLAIRMLKDPTFAKKVMKITEGRRRENQPKYLNETHKSLTEEKIAEIAESKKSPLDLKRALRDLERNSKDTNSQTRLDQLKTKLEQLPLKERLRILEQAGL